MRNINSVRNINLESTLTLKWIKEMTSRIQVMVKPVLQMKNICIGIVSLVVFAITFCIIYEYANRATLFGKERGPNAEMISLVEGIVNVKTTPSFDYSFDVMANGVYQHIDREYTYDYVPKEILGGYLFQGIHRAPKGTSIEIDVLSPLTIYFFFHHQVEGGYSIIFKDLKSWERLSEAPKYDIHNGSHGLKMVMYRTRADIGKHIIPPTTKDKACFNIVFVQE